MMKNLLLIFTKNPEKGKVKTRLAETVGEDKALEIYEHLLKHTVQTTTPLGVDKRVCYASFISENDAWPKQHFGKNLQKGEDLGERMAFAFQEGFDDGYEQIIIIGSDCLEITTALLESAFDNLKTHDIVLGPSEDGGYYLLGMNTFHPEFFKNKSWSTSSVLKDTLANINERKLTCYQLPILNDIDTEEDWNNALKKHPHVNIS